MKNNSNVPTGCTVDFAFKRLGGKYKGRIIWYLYTSNVLRYGEIKRITTGITPKMLTQSLKELEEDQLISKSVYIEKPLRVEYRLTETGKEFVPFIKHLNAWVIKQMDAQASLAKLN